MTLDDALADLGATGNALPRGALRWLLDHWDQAGPRLAALLDRYARGQDCSERTERALFFVIHLLGEKAETAAFGPLCRLLLDADASDLILGDAVTETLRDILISTYDGDLAALQGVIEAEAADEFVREAALVALAYLARTGRVPEAEMHAYLLHLLAEMRPQEAFAAALIATKDLTRGGPSPRHAHAHAALGAKDGARACALRARL